MCFEKLKGDSIVQVKVLVSEAIEVLEQHRERHIQDYKEALATWREDLAAYTDGLTAWAVDMQGVRPSEPSAPRNYLGEYDRLIAKLCRHKEETLVLEDTEYAMVFEDRFYWQSSFQRQKAPIYTMGSADATSRARLSGDNIISGSITNTKSVVEQPLDGLHVPIEED